MSAAWVMPIEIRPSLIVTEPADDVGEGLERVWYAGHRMPGYRWTEDPAFTLEEWVAAFVAGYLETLSAHERLRFARQEGEE